MLNIYLCEDNEKQRLELAGFIENVVLMEDFDLNFALATANPLELLSYLEKQSNTGIYFLDIDLGTDMNGLTLAQEIRKLDPRGFIVFVTTHSEMSYMTFSYKVEAMDFIIKDDSDSIKDRVKKCIVDAYGKYSSPNNNQKVFRTYFNDKEICILLDDIFYFETSENIHKVVLHAKDKLIEFQAKLKDVEPCLDERFCRCHRSYIVNKDFISEVNLKDRIITLFNDETILASKQGIKNIL